MKAKKVSALLVATAMVCGIAGGTTAVHADPEYTIKLCTEQTDGDPIDEGCDKWAELVDEATDGAVKIEVYPNSQLGAKADLIEMALAGQGVYKADIRDIIKQLCSYKGVEIIEGHLMPDHIHMLVSIPPKISVSSFMGYLKGKSALMIFDKHANLKYKFGNRHFWAEGYYVSTVGLNEATIKKYIQEQEKHDIAMDKLSVKEYEDPFKG